MKRIPVTFVLSFVLALSTLFFLGIEPLTAINAL